MIEAKGMRSISEILWYLRPGYVKRLAAPSCGSRLWCSREGCGVFPGRECRKKNVLNRCPLLVSGVDGDVPCMRFVARVTLSLPEVL